jgi:NAD(P)H dehydrogenase (quinone)
MTSSTHPRLFVTGATGQLGRLVIDGLLRTVPASRIVAGVRNAGGDPAKSLLALGIEVRMADYMRPNTLAAAFEGIDRLLLISSSEVGQQRVVQHRNVIDAAKQAGIGLIAYTSLLHADRSPLALGEEHRRTEAALQASGVPFVVLRNGWYTENYAGLIPAALAQKAFLGCAGQGRIASATRVDYADAAGAVLTATDHRSGQVYELAGDEGYTLAEFAEEIAKAADRPVVYRDLPEAEFKALLIGAGLQDGFAALLADSDAGAAKGALFDGSRHLSALIGRATTPMSVTVAAYVKR